MAVPGDVGTIASRVVSGLVADTDAGRIALRAALAAAPLALDAPRRDLVARLVDLPSAHPVSSVVNAFVALDTSGRKAALDSYAALN
ncbi:MAG: hypothetical protein JNK82_37615 [Myxococcaceae bacterium]|nr:hypothetical protein [Myxococcaceae bacterium]